MAELYKSDPTRPRAPAFTKLVARKDIMERQAARKAKGGMLPPMLFAKMDHQKGKRDGK